jgi:hypothetical protein
MEKIIYSIVTGIVVGVIMLMAQLFITPKIERDKLVAQEQWKAKRIAFSEAISLVDQHFSAGNWTGPDVPKKQTPTVEKPSPLEINRVYSELMLLSEDIKIPKAYITFFNTGGSAGTRGEFIIMLRKELFKSEISIKPEDIPFITGFN